MRGIVWVALLAGVAAQGASLQGITPGHSTRVEMHRRLGEAVKGTGTAVEQFTAKGSGLARIILYYDAKSLVRRARLDPAEPLTLDLATLLFSLKNKARAMQGHPFDAARGDGRAVHYDADGVKFFLAKEIVREIWLVVPGDAWSPEARRMPVPVVPTPTPMPVAKDPGLTKAPPTLVLPQPPERIGERPLVSPPAADGPKVSPPPVSTPAPNSLRAVRVGQGAAAFKGLAIGRSTRSDVRSELGAPTFVSLYSEGAYACEYAGQALGLRSVVVRYRPDGTVGQIELRFAEPMQRSQVLALLGLGRPAHTLGFEGFAIEAFPSSGVELVLRHGNVVGLRLAGAEAAAPEKRVASPALEGPGVQRAGRGDDGLAGTQRVKVGRVWCKPDVRQGGEPGLMVYADVAARACKGRSLMVTVRLRHHDGRPVKAAGGAPAVFADGKGRFVAWSPDQVRYDPAEWRGFAVFVPYRHLALDRGRLQQLVVTLSAACDGETNGVEALTTFRMP